MILLAFLMTFLSAAIATIEVLYIRDSKVIGSAVFAALNQFCWWLAAFFVISDFSRHMEYLPALVLGNSLATGIIVWIWKRRKHGRD